MPKILEVTTGQYLLSKTKNRIYRVSHINDDTWRTCHLEKINSAVRDTLPCSLDSNEIDVKFKKIWYFQLEYLNPFDLVIVRNYDTQQWGIATYAYSKIGECHAKVAICDNNFSYSQCVPYNYETKYLVGTKLLAPDFYYKPPKTKKEQEKQ